MAKGDKWKDITIAAIEYLQKQKETSKKHPTHVNVLEITKLSNEAIRTTLKMLVESGDIKEVDTMHGKCYELITKMLINS